MIVSRRSTFFQPPSKHDRQDRHEAERIVALLDYDPVFTLRNNTLFGLALVDPPLRRVITRTRSMFVSSNVSGSVLVPVSASLIRVMPNLLPATPEGKKELVGLLDGVRESALSWRELLLDLRRRGLAIAPELAVADGALGFWQAVEEVWPNTRGQRCWVHKTANVLNKLPKSQQPSQPSTPSARPGASNTTRRSSV